MKKYISILVGAALLAACEQKTETVTPASPTATPAAESSPITAPVPAETATATP